MCVCVCVAVCSNLPCQFVWNLQWPSLNSVRTRFMLQLGMLATCKKQLNKF